jgi:hypothetical protein
MHEISLYMTSSDRWFERCVAHVYRKWCMQGACNECEGLDVCAVLVMLVLVLVLVLLLQVRLCAMIDRASALHHIYSSAAPQLLVAQR